jgi:hypothetical protein
MTIITFVPASAESTYKLSLHSHPREKGARLSWLAKVDREKKVFLAEDGGLEDFECFIEVTVDEPYDGKTNNESWDYAHGFLRWVGGSQPCLVTLVLPAETFASLTDLAKRGSLPSLTISCIPGHGLENAGPYGDIKWDNTGDKLVPVKHIQLIYSFSVLD